MNGTLKGLGDTEIIALYQKIYDNEPMKLTGKYPSPKRYVSDEKNSNEVSITETRQDSQQHQTSNSFHIFDDIDEEEDSLRPMKITSLIKRTKRDEVTKFDDVLQSIAKMRHDKASVDDHS